LRIPRELCAFSITFDCSVGLFCFPRHFCIPTLKVGALPSLKGFPPCFPSPCHISYHIPFFVDLIALPFFSPVGSGKQQLWWYFQLFVFYLSPPSQGSCHKRQKPHKRQRRKLQSVTAKKEKSQTPKVLTAILA